MTTDRTRKPRKPPAVPGEAHVANRRGADDWSYEYDAARYFRPLADGDLADTLVGLAAEGWAGAMAERLAGACGGRRHRTMLTLAASGRKSEAWSASVSADAASAWCRSHRPAAWAAVYARLWAAACAADPEIDVLRDTWPLEDE